MSRVENRYHYLRSVLVRFQVEGFRRLFVLCYALLSTVNIENQMLGPVGPHIV